VRDIIRGVVIEIDEDSGLTIEIPEVGIVPISEESAKKMTKEIEKVRGNYEH